MKFAMNGVGTGSTARPAALQQVVQKAEALGFESIWIPEHLVIPVDMRTPYPYSPDGKFPGGPSVALHDPMVALAFVAGCTTRIKLGTGVFVLPLRNPLATAKAVATLDVLSNGRLLFGIGIGWLEEEFNAVGVPFKDRAARTREFVRMMKALWSEETPEFSGRFQSFPRLGFNPKPVQKPHPPLIVGGETRVALKRAAEIGDGWYGSRFTPDQLTPVIAQLRAFAEAAGRDFSHFEITCGIGGDLPFNLDTVRRFEDVGVHRLMAFAPGFVPRAKFETHLFPHMERFAEEVIAKV
ncbi:MAG TPA: LLM class F420-dependent oxidoreductase [Candidatus Binatia bacterium]|nr:LLM class F420-dependent oxidoreductase [Candidatus Binatia bacterium]